jgi:hypothetical protein
MKDLHAIQELIRKQHGCESLHVQSVPVTEKLPGGALWAGDVEVFELLGHPKARRCYAVGQGNGSAGRHYITVLKLPPVDSPQRAAQAALSTFSKP